MWNGGNGPFCKNVVGEAAHYKDLARTSSQRIFEAIVSNRKVQ